MRQKINPYILIRCILYGRIEFFRKALLNRTSWSCYKKLVRLCESLIFSHQHKRRTSGTSIKRVYIVSSCPGPSQADQSTTVFNNFTCRVIKSSPSSQLTTVGQGWTISPAIAGRLRLLITAGVFWKGNVESANRI